MAYQEPGRYRSLSETISSQLRSAVLRSRFISDGIVPRPSAQASTKLASVAWH